MDKYIVIECVPTAYEIRTSEPSGLVVTLAEKSQAEAVVGWMVSGNNWEIDNSTFLDAKMKEAIHAAMA